MLTEQTHTEPGPTEHNWALLHGTILDGGYEMQELLEADGRRARFKIRVLGDRSIDAFASFFPVDGKLAEEQIAAWEILRRSPHPNLSTPLAAGQRQLDGADVIYVVLRRADETLSGVLDERALTPQEASEVLLNSSRALEHLRGHGLVHGSVTPEQVLAVGDTIQLSTEGVRRAGGGPGLGLLRQKYVAPESAGGNGTAAADVWSLGATVFETVTQKECVEGCREKAKQLPGPLGWVLEACLDPDPETRVAAQEIPVLFQNKPAMPVPTPAETPVEAKAEPPKLASVPAEERKAASAAASAAAEGTLPGFVPAAQSEAEAAQARPKISSASQARVKVFKQAGFDALTAPEAVPPSGGGPARASKSMGATTAGAASLSGGAQPAAASAPAAPHISVPQRSVPQTGESFRTAQTNPRRVPDRRETEFGPEAPRSRLWMYLAAGAVALLLLVVWASRPKQAKTIAPANRVPAVASSSAPTTAAPPVDKAWQTRTLEPEKALPGAVTPTEKAEPAKRSPVSKAEAAAASGAVWRVVVYTFSKPADAQKRAHTINAKHPRLAAQVFSPNGQTGPYLVTLGGRMSREDAARWRSRAIGSGMPRDSYIQNYKQ